jgi:DNA-binding IclR family transcriptional regulator
MCYGIVVPARRPDGPYAASITLLRARATDERVPLLIEDLRWLAAALSDPLRRQVQPA